ncbi:MAG: hypothetical protein DMD31_00345 [Gemmatimonadetes bacterium]|nr:MAG: hypothetical protein DMD31_00345 [Gemmatimonadota bacterium]
MIGIVVALLVAVVTRSARVPLPAAMNIGLAFEIASSYAIAAAEFADPMMLEMHHGMIGLSWVAVWMAAHAGRPDTACASICPDGPADSQGTR